MIKMPTETVRVISLPEGQYCLGNNGALQLLVPSIAISFTSSRFNNSDNNTFIGYDLRSADGLALTHRFWEIKSPVRPQQTIRGLKLLADCPSIEDDTLCACYHAANRELSETTLHYLKSLKDAGFHHVEEYREKLLSEDFTSSPNYEKLLKVLADNHISTDTG